ncbi:DUF5696 domain-containing protein [Cohnella silvisoli]|uniref:DUF5696 domain-containing protein n=1 Tax=Cohnella silvisoli TaxID=2873699 RepID=A0ABV1L3J2_9BACL|nr:DUF5696 domain-containing protein [Cohnella silvisoli]MCD9026178.1 hypothetical protein [Cohnella silvisoli]
MASIRRPGKKAWISLGLAAVACVIALTVLLERSELPTLEEMGLEPQAQTKLQVRSGEAWLPQGGDAAGYVTAIENENFALRIHPQTTQIIVTDKRSGYEWRSNPPEEKLADEKVKGLLLSNLKSPLVMDYFGFGDKARRDLLNTTSKKLRISFLRYEGGLQVSYEFTDKQIGVIVQYELSDHGLIVHVPDDGITEKGEFAIFSLDVLPYFGAAKPGEDGYILLPDGPGGIIKFNAPHSSLTQGYSNQIYGSEVSNVRPDSRKSSRGSISEGITYPVFGVKRGDNAYLAIIKEGKEETVIKAMPAGLKSTYYNVNASFMYREEFLRKNGILSMPFKTVESDRMKLDRTVEYRFMIGKEANYTGMAVSYREELQASGQLGDKMAPAEHIPLTLNIVGGNSQDAYNREQYIPVTTFEQAERIVTELSDSGMSNIRIVYYGWQDGGDFNAAKRFPIENGLGGSKAAKTFVDRMHELGFTVLFEDNFVYVDARSSISAKSKGVRGINGTVFFNGSNEFLLKPELTLAYAFETIEKLKPIGVDGIHYNWLGEFTFRDYEKTPTERRQTSQMYRNLLAYTQQQLGRSGVYSGSDFSLGAVDHISDFPLEGNYYFMVDETVPFYPIAIHGYVSYSSTAGNMRDDYEGQFLKAIEYGALPAFYVTWERSRLLKNTASDYLFSSEFDLWKERMMKEYKDFDKLAALFNQAIVAHDKRSDTVFVTTYEDGTEVTVDYGKRSFEVAKGGNQ